MLEINPNMKFGVITDDPENARKFIPQHPSLVHLYLIHKTH